MADQRIPANVQDRLIYAAHRCKLTNMQNQAVLELKGRLNKERLEKALRLLINTEPVLGSRFIEDRLPYWEKAVAQNNSSLFLMENTRNKQKAVNEFLTKPLNTESGQQVNVKLVRADLNDTLCIKISHACCDGGGLKAFQHALAQTYTQLGKEEKLGVENSVRKRIDPNILFNQVNVTDMLGAMGYATLLQPTWAFPYCDCEPGEQLLAIRRLPRKHFNLLYAAAKKRGVSLNDLILTAFYRAMFKIIAPPPRGPKEILITVDLRRYLQESKGSAINNFSSAVPARLAYKPGEPFNKTLARVASYTSVIKNESPGYQVALIFRLLSMFNYEQTLSFVQGIKNLLTTTGKCSPILSNVGNISESTIWFDKIPVTDAYQVSPAIYAPGFMLGVCTYNEKLTFTVSYYEPGILRKNVEHFLNILLQELRSLI